jgi:AcrR family transcriptional regulator
LLAAERRFATAGFAGASVREIAADAGLKNQASLYHYFQDKAALYDAVLERGVQALLAIWREDAGPADAPSIDRVIDYLAEHPHLARLIQRAGIDDDGGADQRSGYARDAAVRILAPLYDEGVAMLAATTAWPKDELPHLAAGLYHLIFGYFASAPLLHAIIDEDPQSPAMLERQRRFLAAAIDRLLTPRS